MIRDTRSGLLGPGTAPQQGGGETGEDGEADDLCLVRRGAFMQCDTARGPCPAGKEHGTGGRLRATVESTATRMLVMRRSQASAIRGGLPPWAPVCIRRGPCCIGHRWHTMAQEPASPASNPCIRQIIAVRSRGCEMPPWAVALNSGAACVQARSVYPTPLGARESPHAPCPCSVQTRAVMT